MRLDRQTPAISSLLLFLSCASGISIVTSQSIVTAQTYPQASPEDLGLILPKAPSKSGDGRRVLLSAGDSDPRVGIVHVEIGDRYIVVLPSGRLVSVKQSETSQTDRPFMPLSKQQMAKALTKGKFRGFKTNTTRRYLCIYNTSDEFALATSRILETMYPGLFKYCQRQIDGVHEPKFPLVVLMFKTQDEFHRYRQMPENLVAYYNTLSNYIVLFEQSDLVDTAPDLAFKQSISTIAHEGVHQILHNIGVQQRLSNWPLWISEGLAEYFAPTELGRRVRWKGVGFVNDLRLHELSEFYKARNGITTKGQLPRQTVETRSLNSLGYASSWAMVHYFAQKRRQDFYEYLREVSKSKPLDEVSTSLFIEHFGSNYVELEQDLLQHLKSLPYRDPIANQTHYVVMAASQQRRSALVTASPAEIRRFQEEHTNVGQLQIQTFPSRAVAKRFADRWLQGR